MDCLGAGCRV
uniref:Uncharacterized protein n=1 Tax=Arundo donax TaxID=35708 RepID=A0A0A8ZA71_ARUDO